MVTVFSQEFTKTYTIKHFRISERRQRRYYLRIMVATPPPIFEVLYYYNADPSGRTV
jgi:hypothetical protein